MTTRDEIAAIADGFSDAAAEGDVDRLLGYYADDAQLQFAGRPVVRGRSEIKAFFRTNSAPSHVRFENESIIEGGDLVIDVGRYLNFGPTGRSGPVVSRGKYVVVYRREGGALKIVVDAASTDALGSD